MSTNTEITVIGAGVIGLTSALKLSESGYNVTIVAAHFPSDGLSPKYTSNWAGAHYRPFPSHTEKDFQDSQLTRLTQDYFRKLSVLEPESSIRFIPGVDYVEEKGIYDVKAKGYFEEIKDLEEIPADLLPKGVQFGAQYDTWVLNSPFYLQYLERKLRFQQGVRFIKSDLISLNQISEASPSSSTFINCTGLGLQYQGGYDPKCFPIRGQTLLLRVPPTCPYLKKTITHQGKDGLWTFVIPRPLNGGVILGGTKQFNDLQSTPRDSDTESLIERAKVLYPEVFFEDGTVDIQGVNVGFRPAREGGVRVEAEVIEGKRFVHAYGAGGMGFELSYGVACKVQEIVGSPKQKSKL
ncbi:hypothetical protein WICPIJ_005148 [Wickerhamomyces pijperi]|uniref:FAD dependent oxidoreductase domain-containing protein n=1 Tax=Wickerhamomyces pijperi TaxID=599730 RepID=A0A9P8Q4M3_WICPI|nr:hypothetical protein WICPIJ_005148 [Wickerhamomyces pijperi]